MERRQFLCSALVGAAAMLPGAGLLAKWDVLAPVSTEEPLLPIWEAAEAVLERLLLSSLRQLELVEDGNGTELLQHLSKRQELWHEFELLEQPLTPHLRIPAERRGCMTAEEWQIIKVVVKRRENLLKNILDNDLICLNITSKQMEEVNGKLQEVETVYQFGTEYQITEMAKKSIDFNTAVSIIRHNTLLLANASLVPHLEQIQTMLGE